MTTTKQYQCDPCLCFHLLSVLGPLRGHGSHIKLPCTDMCKQNRVNYKLAIHVKSRHLLSVKTLKVLIFCS